MKDSQPSDLQTPYQTPQSDLEQLKSKNAEYGEFKLFSTKGRVGRVRYFVYFMGIILLPLIIALLAIGNVNMAGTIGTIVGIAMPVIIMFVLGTNLILTVQRLHDFNGSGWAILLVLIPLINFFFILSLLFIPGTDGPNRFGPPGPPNTPTEAMLARLMGLLMLLLWGIQLFALNFQITN